MSGNYPHIPPPINMHSVSANKPKNDFIGPPPSVNQWNMSQPNEFENREKYMETQLTEEHYTPCDLDSNANQNEIPDDDPCPPPGLRRLVTGQTVSFDDGPVSPPFDRIVPGEGNTFSNYPQSTKITKPPTDSYNDKRFVSGSTNKDYNSQPYQPFVPPPKKDNVSTYNNNFYNPVENSAFNSSTQDFFDTYLRGNSAAHDVENTSKGNQYGKNKFQGLPSGFQNYEADKRDNYFQSEKSSTIPKPSSNAYADDFPGKNVNHHFQPNFPARPNNHMAVDTKSHKPLENIPYASSENKSNDDGYSENRRPSFDNYGHDQPPFVGNYDTGYNQKLNTIPSRSYAEETNVEGKNREVPNYLPSTHKPDNFQVFDGNYYTVGNTAENTPGENKYSDNQTQENMEKVTFHGRADYERNRKDDSGYNTNIGRMAVEGSSDVCYSKPPPSASMQTQSPNYDYWYSNNSQKSFADEHKNTNDQGKLLKEQNSFYANKHRNEKPQNVPSLDTASPRLISPASASSPASANPYEAMHSKTQSMSSNTSSLNENLPYQSNENYNVHENMAKRYDRGIKPENMNTSSGPYAHNFRTNENVIDKNKLIGRPSEENFTNDLKQRYPQQNESNHETLKSYESHQNFENISAQEEMAENSGEHVSKVNQENYINQDESFANRDPLRKDMQMTSERSFIDQRKPNNLEVGAGADVGKEVNLKSPYRKNSLGGNEERICSEGLSLERGTVPGAQSTPNDVAPNRSFINVNNSSSYSSTNLFQTIEDEEEREETTHYSDSDEKPMNRSRILGYHSNTIPGPRSVSRKFGRDSKMSKLNKMKPPLEGRMVVGEGSSDAPTTQSNRSRDDGPYEDDKQRHIHPKDKDSGSRYERDRKKPLYRRDHRKPESDDEDYEDFGDRAYDNSPDRESRSYLDKHYRGSPRHLDKRSSRRDRESSFTQSQDESFFDDDDDDYDTYRNRRRYYDRRYPRDAGYKQYGHESFYRDGYRDRRVDYYGRYEDESFYGGIRTSRPSSRSGSEYRPGFMDYGNQRYYNRPPYYEYLDHRHLVNFGGGPRLSKREMEYWSKVREMEPQKYMHWYKTTFPKEYYEWYSRHVTGKIMQNSQDNRRGSGHSGQSSVNDANSVVEQKFSDLRADLPTYEPVERDTLVNQEIRCTPAKFTVPHVKGIFNTLGQLVVVNACSPHDGQPAVVDFYQIPTPENDSDFIEFTNFTGPFIVGETHVNTVSDFVRYYANITPHPSAKLLYQLIELIIKQRGRTDGIAISELLMENYRDSQKFTPVASKEDAKLTNNIPPPSEAEIIEKYTDLLLLGNKNDALEYAVNNKLWGHAFLLASKMGSKHYSKVLAKFDNSISMNNPLKTLYQLYSKQIPQASTACANEKWGDWRPHLAMMLSNPTSDSEFDKQAIITLGDSLVCKDVFAAHFCYLAAETDFEPPTKSSTKYTLLSLRNNLDNLGVNTPNHAILLTQVYEFAKRLQNKDFTINALMPYKYLLATRLVDYGKVSVALQYLESIAMDLMQCANDQDQELIYNVIELSEHLKYSDAKPLEGDLCSDKQWLINLRQLANNNYDNNQISYSTPCNEQPSFAESQPQYPDQSFMQQQSHVLGQQYVKQTPQFVQNDVRQPLFMNQPSQPTSLPPNVPPQSQDRRPSQPWDSNFNAQEQSNIMSPDYGYTQPEYNKVPLNRNDETADTKDTIAQQNHDQYDQPSVADNQQNSYYSQWDQPQQTVSISSTQSFSFFDKEEQKMPLQAEPSRNRKEENQAQQNARKDNDRNAKDNKSENGNHSGSWLGGIFSKIVRPKNEMKLPDDKNPSIVWSEEHQRWINKNGDDEDSANVIKPPPKASELKAFQTHATNQIPRPNEIPLASNANFAADRNKPPSMDSSNIYKRGKGMKAKYVNVLSQSTTPSNTNLPPPGMMDYSKTQVPSNMKLFVPSSDGPSSMPNDLPSNSDNLQARNTNPDTPMFYNPAQYST